MYAHHSPTSYTLVQQDSLCAPFVSFNQENTQEQVSGFLVALKQALHDLRQMTAVAA